MGRCPSRWTVLALLAVGSGSSVGLGCKKEPLGTRSRSCEGALTRVDEPIGYDLDKLPVIAELVDVEAPVREESLSGCGAEYGGKHHHQAKLGPLAASYTASDYKGLEIATNTALALSSPSCPGAVVTFTMAGPSFVRLRRDPARDLYVVTGGILEDRAVALRIGAPARSSNP